MGEYAAENTLVIGGEGRQNMIALAAGKPMTAEKPVTASYVVYLPDGTVYDRGTREPYDFLGSRLYWTDDKSGIGLIAPFEPGEYIYEVTIGWETRSLNVTYGIKLIMTGERYSFTSHL
jgi:hypothetical protein